MPHSQFFWCARGSRCLRVVVVLASRESHSISSMFHRTLPTAVSTSLHRFVHLHLVRLPLLRFSILRRVHPLSLCQEGHALADWLNSPSPRLWAHVSAVTTHRSTHLRERAVSTRTSTISRPLWVRLKSSTTNVGQMASPLFSPERELSANPFDDSCSQTRSSMKKSRRDVEQVSTFGNPLSESTGNRYLECAGFSNGKGQNSVRTENPT